MNFSDDLADLDASVEDNLCDDADYSDGVVSKSLRVMLDHPVEIERLQGSGFSRAKPILSVAYAAAPDLREGHVFTVAGEDWEVASAPTRPGDGRWWQVEVVAA